MTVAARQLFDIATVSFDRAAPDTYLLKHTNANPWYPHLLPPTLSVTGL
jgi:hypothetical protein